MPLTSSSEYERGLDSKLAPTWFALDESRPLGVFAEIWASWSGVRKASEGWEEAPSQYSRAGLPLTWGSHLKADKSYDRTAFAADFEQGQFAFLHGVSQEGCPYNEVAPRAAWTLGWLAAENLFSKHVILEPGRRSRV